MRIAVDVDGVLANGEDRYWKGMCEANEDIVTTVNQLYKDGHTIIIWTARPWDNARQLKAFLTLNGVRHHGIMMEKGSADVYLDDKARHITSAEKLKEVANEL